MNCHQNGSQGGRGKKAPGNGCHTHSDHIPILGTKEQGAVTSPGLLRQARERKRVWGAKGCGEHERMSCLLLAGVWQTDKQGEVRVAWLQESRPATISMKYWQRDPGCHSTRQERGWQQHSSECGCSELNHWASWVTHRLPKDQLLGVFVFTQERIQS